MTLLTVPVSGADKLEAVGAHRVGSKYDRQVLVINSELPESDDDAPRLLVESLAVPVRVQLVQRPLDVVVLTHPDRVLRRYSAELVHASVALPRVRMCLERPGTM